MSKKRRQISNPTCAKMWEVGMSTKENFWRRRHSSNVLKDMSELVMQGRGKAFEEGGQHVPRHTNYGDNHKEFSTRRMEARGRGGRENGSQTYVDDCQRLKHMAESKEQSFGKMRKIIRILPIFLNR